MLAVGLRHVSPMQHPPGHEVSLHLLDTVVPTMQSPSARSQRDSAGHCESALHRA